MRFSADQLLSLQTRNDAAYKGIMALIIVVNAANSNLLMGGGVCGAIFKAAGSIKLQVACAGVSPIKTGSAAITSGFKLQSKHIIHAVGPVYHQWNAEQSKQLLRSAYIESLKLVLKSECSSIAFPLISGGIYGYPKDEALKEAVSAIKDFLVEHDMDVYLVIFERDFFEVSKKMLGDAESCINENYV